MSKQATMRQWIAYVRQEKDRTIKRQSMLLYSVASFVLKQAKINAREKFGRGIGKTARTRGRSGALMRSIDIAAIGGRKVTIVAGGPGVPYAMIHEFGTVGKGGALPDIVPKPPRRYLTIPVKPKYVGRRATEFKGKLVFDKDKWGRAYLFEKKFQEKGDDHWRDIAYMLVRRSRIPARPYLGPAIQSLMTDAAIAEKLKKVYGDSPMQFIVTGGTWRMGARLE